MADPLTYLVVFERDGDGGYGAWVPDLPGCFAAGATRDRRPLASSLRRPPHRRRPDRRPSRWAAGVAVATRTPRGRLVGVGAPRGVGGRAGQGSAAGVPDNGQVRGW
jgi:hypothetical protein